nr:Gag-Pol polyprotein [Tanacetum cinerariifolium]
MSQDVLIVGSIIRIPLLYRGEYSQWVERFMNYLEEQTDGKAMINSIMNSDQPLPRVTQVSIAETTSTEQSLLKDKSMCNKTTKDLWDALARHMLGSKYGEQDRKATVLYEYETFKATEGELLLDTYIRYLQVINDLKKCGYSKDICELNFKFLNNLQPEWKQYAIMMRQNKNLMDINIDALYNILKQNQGDVNDAMGSKKKTIVVTSDPLALIAEKTNVTRSKEKVVISSDSEGSKADDFSELKKITALLAKVFNRRKFYSKPTNNNLITSSYSQSTNKKQEFVKTDNKIVEKKDDKKKRDMSRVKCYNCKKEGYFAKDCKKVKVKNYEYYKTKMLLAKKDKDEQVLLAEDQAWMELSSDSDEEINANMVFMAQIKKVLSDSEASSSSADEKISKQTSLLKPYVPNVIFKKIIINLENEVVNLLEKEKANLETIESLKSKGFESSESFVFESENQNENDCHKIEKVCDKKENPKLKRKRRKRKSSKQNVKQVDNDVSRANNDFVHFSDLNTFSSVRRPKNSGVIWKKKGSSNTPNVGLSAISVSNLNKNVKRYSRKDLLACNNSHPGDTRSDFVCNDAMNVSCDSRMNDLLDDNNFFIFDDVNVRISPVSKMLFRKKPRYSMHIVQICLWNIDSGCSKHMTGNRALLTNFVEKFLETVRFGNNDFAVIAGYGDVVICSMTIKKVYYVEGLGH